LADRPSLAPTFSAANDIIFKIIFNSVTSFVQLSKKKNNKETRIITSHTQQHGNNRYIHILNFILEFFPYFLFLDHKIMKEPSEFHNQTYAVGMQINAEKCRNMSF
jgi:hypothetical protein